MKKLFCCVLALALVMAMLTACGGAPGTPPAASGDYEVATLKLEGGTDWGTPNPFLHATRGPGTAKMRLVYASLLEKDETGDVPWLAETWKVEGNSYTFTLYEGLTFHDGTPLTAQDVAFTLDYNREHPPLSNSLGTGEGYIVSDYHVVDERTITITVSASNADTLSNLGSVVILPRHIWSGVEDPYTYTGDGYLVGSGAYCATTYEAATGSYEFTAFDGWKGYAKPAAQRILFVPVSDALVAFEQGEIDITAMPVDLADRYRTDPTVGIVEKANDSGYKLLVNFEKCPQLLDLKLRQALYAALDREKIVADVFRGAGTVGSAGYVPQGSLFYNAEVVSYAYDPETARAVFAELGLSVTLLISDGSTDVAIGEIVRNNLQAAGIGVQVQAYDSATRDAMVNDGDYEFAIVGNGGWSNNPPSYMRTVFSDVSKNAGGNPHSMGPIGYSNTAITRLAEDQVWETDFEARKQMFKDLQLLVSQEIPLFVLANQSTYSMYRSQVYDGWMKTYAYQQVEQNRLSYMERD